MSGVTNFDDLALFKRFETGKATSDDVLTAVRDKVDSIAALPAKGDAVKFLMSSDIDVKSGSHAEAARLSVDFRFKHLQKLVDNVETAIDVLASELKITDKRCVRTARRRAIAAAYEMWSRSGIDEVIYDCAFMRAEELKALAKKKIG